MLVLAGAVLVLAFLVAAFAALELNTEQAELEQGPQALAEAFHDTRDEFASALQALTIPSTSNATLLEQFEAQRLEFEERARAHGLFAVLERGHDGSRVAQRTEAMMTDGAACGTATYTVRSHDGRRDYASLLYDCEDDGLLWGGATQNLRGLVVHLALSDPTARLEESFVVSLN